MKLCVVYPKDGHTAYKIAAEAFSDLAIKTSDAKITTTTDIDFLNKGIINSPLRW
jgi:hypothetical protein